MMHSKTNQIKKQTLFFFLFAAFYLPLSAQVSVNDNGNTPDPSAMLDVESTDKGILIPRMNSSQRDAIANPADGLMVFDLTTSSFWYFDSGEWHEIKGGKITYSDLTDSLPEQDFSCLNRTDSLSIYTYSMEASGKYLYNLDPYSEELSIIDAADPSSLGILGSVAIGPFPKGMAMSGNYVYTGQSFPAQMRVVDISDPTTPSVIATMGIGGALTGMAASGNYVFLAFSTSSNQLQVIDVSTPASPSLISTFDLGGSTQVADITAENDYVYLLDKGSDELKIIDMNNPVSPMVVGNIGVMGDPYSLSLNGNYVYVADRFHPDLVIIDISIPTSPIIAGTFPLAAGQSPYPISRYVTSSEGLVMVSDNDTDDLKIIDVSNPALPTLVKSFSIGSSPKGVATSDNILYAANDMPGKLVAFQMGCSFFLQADPITGELSPFTGELQDNLGNHTASQNLQLGLNWLSGDGDDEGLVIDDNGNIGVGINNPQHKLDFGATLGRKLALYQNSSGTSLYGFGISGSTLEVYAANNTGTDPRMVVKSSGRVGIGNTDPLYFLDVTGSARFTSVVRTGGITFDGSGGVNNNFVGTAGNYLSFGHSGVSEDFISYKANTFYFKDAPGGGDVDDPNVIIGGRLGIGTTNPYKAKVEIEGFVNYLNTTAVTSYNSSGNPQFFSPATFSYSIYASHRISAMAFHARSDKRIKNIEGISDSETDLNTLMQIEITDYRMKDTIAKGSAPIKKVIAQQISEVYPQAVDSNLTEAIPDIYQRAEINDGWIMLATDLQVGERVKIASGESEAVYEIMEVGEDKFRVDFTDFEKIEEVFVYGREVNDFHTVDYEAISMLNVSATQEQQKIIEAQEKRIKALEEENAKTKAAFEARLKTLEALLLKEEGVNP